MKYIKGDRKASFILKKIGYYSYLLFIVFFSWNYWGVLFVIFLYELIKHFDTARNNNFKVFFIESLLLVIIWHLGALFWMININKGLFGMLINIIYYFVPFFCYYLTRNIHKNSLYLIIPIWILFEFHLDKSNFSYPWLIIGNALSNSISLVQWYKYTGVLGGSLWLLLLAYFLYKKNMYLVILFVIPVISHLYFVNDSELPKNIKSKKFITFNIKFYNQQNKNLDKDKLSFYITEKLKKYNVYAVLIPELSLRNINYNLLNDYLSINYLKELIKTKKTKYLFVGVAGIHNQNKLINSIFVFSDNKCYLKVKKKIVPYTEYIPLYLRNYFAKTSYEYTINDSLESIKIKTKIFPLICYESIYSSYVTDNSDNSNLICLFTSEKFLNNSYFGMKQYNDIISLRAIENEIQILKASNYGTSFLINTKGEILKYSDNEINIFNISDCKKNTSTHINKSFFTILITLLITTFYLFKKLN